MTWESYLATEIQQFQRRWVQRGRGCPECNARGYVVLHAPGVMPAELTEFMGVRLRETPFAPRGYVYVSICPDCGPVWRSFTNSEDAA